MIFKSSIKWAALGGLILSFFSLLVHLLLAKYSSTDLVQYSALAGFTEDININIQGRQVSGYNRLWKNIISLDALQPQANPRSEYSVPVERNNGLIYAKVYGGFEKIRTTICDLVAISRLLNATLVIPEIQECNQLKGISSKFKSFSYLYDVDQFIDGLKNDVHIIRVLPPEIQKARKKKLFPIFKPKGLTAASFYIREVLPKLKESKVVGFVIKGGSCLEAILPPSMAEYQRLRCRVAFHALQFRSEILALGHLMVKRLRVSGQHYIAFHPGLVRDTLAYHGCAQIFQDVHTELIQYRRKQMIKEGILKEMNIDSHVRKANGSCPLMPEEVGHLLKAMGYPPNTRIYLAGSEHFGGQRVLIPLRAMFTNLVDSTSLCSKQELSNLFGPETEVPKPHFEIPPMKTAKQLKEEWDKAGPRPRPLPPPPDRPIYQHEKEGWYGWIAEKEFEPNPSLFVLRIEAHRLLRAAIDYIVSVEADAFFPGFNNDGSGWPDFSSMIMGHRLYEMPSARTYRPDRKYLVELLNSTKDSIYHPKRNWTLLVRAHLNKSMDEEGLRREFVLSKPRSFLSHPMPECACAMAKRSNEAGFEGVDECPKWMESGLKNKVQQIDGEDEEEESVDVVEGELEVEDVRNGTTIPSIEEDEEMDPDD